MKERPILFSGPMVRALLDGRKTQTRRLVKCALSWAQRFEPAPFKGYGVAPNWIQLTSDETAEAGAGACPYGRPGDRLWVKETFSAPGALGSDGRKIYRADLGDTAKEPHGLKWKPSIFCTRKASRITLEITGVRVERLLEISEADAKAEGIFLNDRAWYAADNGIETQALFPSTAYRILWESINGPSSWALNPWVWVVEFRRVEQ
jgi:hypothetical protein